MCAALQLPVVGVVRAVMGAVRLVRLVSAVGKEVLCDALPAVVIVTAWLSGCVGREKAVVCVVLVCVVLVFVLVEGGTAVPVAFSVVLVVLQGW
mgnify:CR=1 FL=1